MENNVDIEAQPPFKKQKLEHQDWTGSPPNISPYKDFENDHIDNATALVASVENILKSEEPNSQDLSTSNSNNNNSMHPEDQESELNNSIVDIYNVAEKSPPTTPTPIPSVLNDDDVPPKIPDAKPSEKSELPLSVPDESKSVSENGTCKVKKAPKNSLKSKPKVKTKVKNKDKNKDKIKDGEESAKSISSKRKAANLRKNIKDILQTERLGEETLAAQREEAERRERMNLKLQQLRHEQDMKMLQQQAMNSIDDLPQISIKDLLTKISCKTSTNVSSLEKDCKFSINQRGLSHGKSVPDEEIVLSSDDEAPIPIPTEKISRSAHVSAGALSFGHCGGSVMSASRDIGHENNIISISSEDERDEICDKEIVSLEKARRQKKDSMQSVSLEESDDDCVVISPTPEQDDEKEDKNHDDFNVVDNLGRVLVNVGHPDEDPDVFLAPQIARIVKPHQIGGIRFLYDNVVESVDRFNTSSGFGCILAHSMGLGKTLQAVSFCDVFLRASRGKSVLIIVPINTIQNWLNEFNIWLPMKSTEKANKQKQKAQSSKLSDTTTNEATTISDIVNETVSLNLSFDSTLNLCPTVSDNSEASDVEETEEVMIRSFDVFVLNETVKTLQAREKIITDWGSRGGVLLIGYEMYRMLALKKLKKSSKKPQSFFNNPGEISEAQSLNNIHTWLVDPGPDLVICDEGHRIKNSGASISQALKSIRTKRRVVLTGYPLQNNLMEYWCMVDFIRPNYLGSKVEFSNMFERPISNGQCVDSTYDDRRLMRFRSHVLHSLLEGFVQRRSHAVLKNALPEKQEWVFMLKMTSIQYKLYKEFMQYLSDNTDGQSCGANPIKAFAVCSKIWSHPDALYNVVKKKQSILDDLELEDINVPGSGTDGKSKCVKGRLEKKTAPSQISFFDGNGFTFPRNLTNSYGGGPSSGRAGSEALSLDWAKPIFENYVPGVLENGVKFELLFEIIKETVSVKDKLLVFSQSLLSLDLIENLFHKKFNWAKNYQYYRLDGSTTGLEREKLINNFNSKGDVFVFLVSTRAGSLGINLTGANRVVVLDASWNPCHDCQAVCRIYRYGQTKPCQIYRFVSDCTLEKRIYDRQINKRGMSDRVVDEMNPNAQFKTKDVSSFLVLKHDHLDKLPFIKCDLKPESYSDPILRNILYRMGDKLTQEPFEHESLLIDQKSQRLSATEKRLAHRNYLNEKRTAELQGSSGYTYNRPSYAAYYPRENSVNTSPSSSSSVSRNANYPNSVTNYRQFQLTTEDKFEQHVPALRSKGICVQHIVLKKDSFLADPSGGPDMFLMAGEKIFVLRSEKGTYLRISNGKLIAVRNNPTNSRYPILNIPPNQELTKEQLQGLIYSFLKLPTSSSFGSFDRNNSYQSHPTEQPLPPSPSFFSQHKNHLQVTNARSNSGGDVTLWQPLGDDPPSNLVRPTTTHTESSISNRFKSQTLSALLDSPNGSSSSFNPNLERLSYLANRFPDFSSHKSSSYHQQQRSRNPPNNIDGQNQSCFSSGVTNFSQYPNLSVQNVSNVQSDVELIPISKHRDLRVKSSPFTVESSSSSSGSSFRSGFGGGGRGDSSTSKVQSAAYEDMPPIFNTGTGNSPSRQQQLRKNASFYEDFTITVKSDNGSNSSSSFESSNIASHQNQGQISSGGNENMLQFSSGIKASHNHGELKSSSGFDTESGNIVRTAFDWNQSLIGTSGAATSSILQQPCQNLDQYYTNNGISKEAHANYVPTTSNNDASASSSSTNSYLSNQEV